MDTFPYTSTPTRRPKRRRPSITHSTMSDNNSISIATSRPRRKAATTSRAQLKSESRYHNESRRGRKIDSKSKDKCKAAPKARAKAKNAKAVEWEGEDDDEDFFECPCGFGCETISDCENAQKEVMVRDVGMSIILSSTGTANILVGAPPNQQSFTIHKELLAIHSGYFASLFSSPPTSLSTTPTTSSPDSKANTALEEALTRAMRGASLDVNINGKASRKIDLSLAKNEGESVKMETPEQEDDDDDDFIMISSDQYYFNLSKKRLLTPITTPSKFTPKSRGTTTTMSTPSPSPFITNLLARSTTSKQINNNTTPSPTPTPTPKYLPTTPTPTSTTLPSSTSTPTPSPSTSPFPAPKFYSLPTIHPLPFTLFTCYIHHGTLTPTLLTLTDAAQTCTWEALWALGSKLRAPGFMNYCMESLRAMKSVQDGGWLKPKTVREVWGMGLEMEEEEEEGEEVFGSGTGTGRWSSSPLDRESQTHTTANKLKLFTASLVASLSPLTLYPPTSMDYRNWERTFTGIPSLSLAVEKVKSDLNLNVQHSSSGDQDAGEEEERGKNKKPWDDKFRHYWRVEEVDIREMWRQILEKEYDVAYTAHSQAQSQAQNSITTIQGLETQAKNGNVSSMLKMMALKGEEWVQTLGSVDGYGGGGGGGVVKSESEDDDESEDEEFYGDDSEEEDENEYEYFKGRRRGRSRRKRARR
ncbi:hypothetical protein ONS95_010840 [Cadophora gregata]|uniref:uncharacterized protein n=1 Tax=Cadophora gregata TaxID=51156 RepID=UPI0026DAC364|nr:uncharacterized protein ONS95_010840 [Cadophora gregata]KAK0119388.1 hypothetical protein ONS95_010840 [Cadophora gregata]KAK0120421.1 hypothetical protein ONS96_010637 [Cadophora gregata f. sp. sojae]